MDDKEGPAVRPKCPVDVKQGAGEYVDSPLLSIQFYFFSRLGVLGSAVCVYSLQSIQTLFSNSKYLEKTKVNQQVSAWVSVQPKDGNQDAGKPVVSPTDKSVLNSHSTVTSLSFFFRVKYNGCSGGRLVACRPLINAHIPLCTS